VPRLSLQFGIWSLELGIFRMLPLCCGFVAALLRLCCGSDLNFEPYLPTCCGCCGSRGVKGGYAIRHPARGPVRSASDGEGSQPRHLRVHPRPIQWGDFPERGLRTSNRIFSLSSLEERGGERRQELKLHCTKARFDVLKDMRAAFNQNRFYPTYNLWFCGCL
jgi:hypothetical protein